MPILQKILFLSSIVLIGILLFLNYDLQKLKSWETTQGILIESIKYKSPASKQGFISTDFSNIKYSYNVSNIKYIGYRVSPLEYLYFNKANLKKLPEPKKSVKVFFNPKKPNQSLLFIDYPQTQILMIICVSVMFILLGIFYLNIKRYFVKLIHPSSDISNNGGYF